MKHSLLAAFFERDLSAAEENELGRILAESPDAAFEFAKKAAEFYAGLGLPEPEWPGGGADGFTTGGSGGAGMGGGTGSAGMAGLGGKLASSGIGPWGLVAAVIGGAIMGGASVGTYLAMKSADKGNDIGAIQEPPAVVEPERPSSAIAASAGEPSAKGKALPAAGAGDSAVEVPPDATGNRLVVRVVLEEATPVVIRIYQQDGIQVYEKKKETLLPGRHEFRWDGLGRNGEPVAAGNYRVVLETNKGVMEKVLQVRNITKEDQQ